MTPISIVVTTYESPEWLGKVLWGYAAQTFTDFELIVADDGSSPLTAGLIDQMRSNTDLSINHVWHEHLGFRKCRILNQAVSVANSPYLVFTDGDCIPRNDFVAVHARYARRGYYLSGGIVRLSCSLSHSVRPNEILDGSIFQARNLMSRGLPINRKLRMLMRSGPLNFLFERLSTTRATFNGYNSSAWRDDLTRVNGFDERMQYGGLDRELGERLVNLGIRPKSIRHRTVCLHLDHDRAYKRADCIEANKAIRQQTRILQARWTPYGIDNRIRPEQPASRPFETQSRY
ncbi:MAG: glycosyltransferase family 2 protein [Pirellulaceae bacterium]|nr:glycosyltransferase family 2 protein [Pirellulaceae bacterium]